MRAKENQSKEKPSHLSMVGQGGQHGEGISPQKPIGVASPAR